jgi:signal transduction histidine kinase
MRERAALMGGTLELGSSAAGTTVRALLPELGTGP